MVTKQSASFGACGVCGAERSVGNGPNENNNKINVEVKLPSPRFCSCRSSRRRERRLLGTPASPGLDGRCVRVRAAHRQMVMTMTMVACVCVCVCEAGETTLFKTGCAATVGSGTIYCGGGAKGGQGGRERDEGRGGRDALPPLMTTSNSSAPASVRSDIDALRLSVSTGPHRPAKVTGVGGASTTVPADVAAPGPASALMPEIRRVKSDHKRRSASNKHGR